MTKYGIRNKWRQKFSFKKRNLVQLRLRIMKMATNRFHNVWSSNWYTLAKTNKPIHKVTNMDLERNGFFQRTNIHIAV